jgi:hypothetical protein
MKPLFDSFWRAALYCLHPKVIGLSFLPLILMLLAGWGLYYIFWEGAVDKIQTTIAAWSLLTTFMSWLESWGISGLTAAIAPMILVVLATPLIVVVSLMVVAIMMTPAMVDLVTQRRFKQLERLKGGSFWAGVFGGLWATIVTLVLLVLSLPLWLIPPLVLVLPPLIWGWLTYKVMTYDVLAEHASVSERKTLIAEHRMQLLTIGVICGYLGAAPSIVWASGVIFVVMAPVLIPLAIWIYTLIFAFSGLWFAHYALSALEQMRATAKMPSPGSYDPSSSVTASTTEVIDLVPINPSTSRFQLPGTSKL